AAPNKWQKLQNLNSSKIYETRPKRCGAGKNKKKVSNKWSGVIKELSILQVLPMTPLGYYSQLIIRVYSKPIIIRKVRNYYYTQLSSGQLRYIWGNDPI